MQLSGMNIRGLARTEFPKSVKAAAFRRCCDDKGVPHCENCNTPLTGPNTIFEHVTPDGLGGEPTLENCKVFCRNCASKKTFAQDNPRMQKADRQLKAGLRHSQAKPVSWCPQFSAQEEA
jgi:5-methylcytosine-specific restriction endonuclease McrA